MSRERRLRVLAYVSAAYDAFLALPLLLVPTATAHLFRLGPPEPLITAQLDGLFTLTLAFGYLWAARDPLGRRGYFWVAGVFAKGSGALLFLLDHLLRRSPAPMLLFVATDGTLALATLTLLLAGERRPKGAG